tara:strand:+ start:163 stop:555 length:393 start_codon:yes stop_codon:yes gene_type:complete
LNKFFQFNDFFALGQIFHDCTAYKISIEYLDKAIDLSAYLPINKNRLVRAYELRGNSKIFLNNYQESILDFSKAIKIDPKDSFLYFWRGFAYESIKDYPNAVNDLKISLKLDPDFGLTQSLLIDLEEKDF